MEVIKKHENFNGSWIQSGKDPPSVRGRSPEGIIMIVPDQELLAYENIVPEKMIVPDGELLASEEIVPSGYVPTAHGILLDPGELLPMAASADGQAVQDKVASVAASPVAPAAAPAVPVDKQAV